MARILGPKPHRNQTIPSKRSIYLALCGNFVPMATLHLALGSGSGLCVWLWGVVAHSGVTLIFEQLGLCEEQLQQAIKSMH
eukprot:2828804-Amphidinium_carterae.1